VELPPFASEVFNTHVVVVFPPGFYGLVSPISRTFVWDLKLWSAIGGIIENTHDPSPSVPTRSICISIEVIITNPSVKTYKISHGEEIATLSVLPKQEFKTECYGTEDCEALEDAEIRGRLWRKGMTKSIKRSSQK